MELFITSDINLILLKLFWLNTWSRRLIESHWHWQDWQWTLLIRSTTLLHHFWDCVKSHEEYIYPLFVEKRRATLVQTATMVIVLFLCTNLKQIVLADGWKLLFAPKLLQGFEIVLTCASECLPTFPSRGHSPPVSHSHSVAWLSLSNLATQLSLLFKFSLSDMRPAAANIGEALT